MKLIYKCRPVEITETEWEVSDAAYVIAANYLDSAMEDLNEEELVELGNIYQDVLYTECYSNYAAAAYDYVKGRIKDG